MKSKLKSALLAIGSLTVAIGLITFPNHTLQASLRGVDMWWGTVFPSLLPFFITAELLISFGVVRFIGVLFEPIMRPLFNVPGAGSFVWAMGMASGYPSGAKLTARLRQEKQLTKIEAERLVSFTNASNPLFIVAAVSVGFFHDASLGFLLAVVHYVSNALVGVCMRFYGKNKDAGHEPRNYLSFAKAFEELHETRLNDRRPFGKILGDAIINSVQTLLMIGGFIILFSVISMLFAQVGIAAFLSNGLGVILQLFHLPTELALPMFSGLFEITLGAQLIADTTNTGLLAQAIIVSFVFAFNGLSVQAQVASILAETDIRFFPYFFARLLHGLFASGLTILLFPYLYHPEKTTTGTQFISVFSPLTTQNNLNMYQTLIHFGPMITIVSLGVAFALLLLSSRKHS
ncbi:sporulation integral membrane protein YlbJ [Paraliobacillus ryukyuensis]|uniref:sporulation integral membrane protein YlbJ n=1 Tax=Paraliobacillus ryukyuensis TaxID=200904 RepID=UPI0009A8CC57|nr:sporulation integral membrane protein YlbJ [Paraliobacillus ryukyuensis]